MNIALIGGSGFIGTRLAKDMADAGIEFSIVDKVIGPRFPERTRIADVRDPEELEKALAGCDIVVNLAAEHRDDVTPVSLYTDVNVHGAENICKACSGLGIRSIVFTSSVAVYGEAPPESDESTHCRPFNEYGRTKLLAEQVFREWEKESTENRLAIVRPTVVFGEENRGNVYNLFNQIAARKFMFVGNGRNRKAMAYVGNVSSFLLFLINHPELKGTWNYVDTPIADMNHLVAEVRSKLGMGRGTGLKIPAFIGLMGGFGFDVLAFISKRKFPISKLRIRKFMTDSSFSAQKALSTGFKPPFELKESLDKVLSFEFPDKYRRTSE